MRISSLVVQVPRINKSLWFDSPVESSSTDPKIVGRLASQSPVRFFVRLLQMKWKPVFRKSRSEMVYKIWKIHKKTPISEFHFKQSCRLNNFTKNLRKHLCRSLIFNKGIYSFAFFYWAACNKIQAFCKINLVCTGS